MIYATNIDLGLGFGVPLSKCYLSDSTVSSLEGIFTFEAPSVYTINLPFVFDPSKQGDVIFLPPYYSDKNIVKMMSRTSIISFETSVVYNKYPSTQRSDQESLRSASGVVLTFDSSISLVKGELTMKNVSKTDAKILEGFITSTMCFNENPFSIAVYTAEE